MTTFAAAKRFPPDQPSDVEKRLAGMAMRVERRKHGTPKPTIAGGKVHLSQH
jgi:hypothetical protein